MPKESGYKLRKVTSNDCDLIFEWANDKSVRENSFNSEKINYDEHIRWFNRKLISEESLMYILKVKSNEVGMIRLDKIDQLSYLINYSIAKEHRGNGYATVLLKIIKELNPSNILIGKVKNNNLGSIKAFLNSGYNMKEEESDIKIFFSKEGN